MLSIDSTWHDPADDAANVDYTRSFWDAATPYSDGKTYFNFPGLLEEGDAAVRASYGANHDPPCPDQGRLRPGQPLPPQPEHPPRGRVPAPPLSRRSSPDRCISHPQVHSMPRILLIAAVAIVAAVAVPSIAHGSTFYQEGRTPHKLLLQGGPDETNLVTVEGSRAVVIRDDGAPLRLAGVRTCMRLDARAVSCPAVRRIELDLGERPDVAGIGTPREVEVEGGAGNDTYLAVATDAPSRVDLTAASA